jgi:hypothetical protein
MLKTIIELAEREKAWLDQQAIAENVSAGDIVRKALDLYRHHVATPSPSVSFDDLLAQTRGLWNAGDGLTYQHLLRADWQNQQPAICWIRSSSSTISTESPPPRDFCTNSNRRFQFR